MTTGIFRGEAGALHMFDLPLPDVLRAQLVHGELEPVDADAKAYARTVDPSHPEVQRLRAIDDRLADE